MKDFYIADAARFENQSVVSYFLLAGIGARDTKGGKPYLAMTLADKTGQFEARMWDEIDGVTDHCTSGCYVKVQGLVSKYQGKFQITVVKMRNAAASEIDTADFIPTTQFDIPAMAAELRGYVAAFANPHLRALVLAFLDDPAIGSAFIEAPAAKRLHHAWLGGLLEHVLCLVRVCLATAPFYPEVDPDLLVTGAILHDIGKVRELSWRSSFDYTLEGQLIGHISIAQGMLHEKIALLDAATVTAAAAAAASLETEAAQEATATDATTGDAPDALALGSSGLKPAESATNVEEASVPTLFPQQLRLLIEHMILSHHGKLEFGSPKLPMTPEAMLLSALDDLEAKFQTLRNEFATAKTAGKASTETTEWVRSMERPLFDSRGYLAELAATGEASNAGDRIESKKGAE